MRLETEVLILNYLVLKTVDATFIRNSSKWFSVILIMKRI